MRTLVINLTRFGDLLQSQSVIHALRAGGDEVGLVCLHNFAPAAAFLDGVSVVAPLPGETLLAGLAAHWPNALAALHTWLDTLHATFAPDRVLNLTSTTAARLLARRIAANAPVQGFGVDEHGFGVSGSAWTAFFEASTLRRGCSPYNIVDLFLRASGGHAPATFRLRPPGADAQAAAAERLHAAAGGRQQAGYIAFQLGASEARRQWPTAYFAALGHEVFARHGLLPVLLGAGSERALAAEYLATGAPGVDLVGATSLPELAAVLTQARLLVTNDTGTMHLAAGLGIPSLALFLATAQPWDTGPYLPGCCTLEPALDCHPCAFGSACPHATRCVRHITPAAVWPLVDAYLDGRGWVCPPATAALARVWQSEPDALGYMDLRALSGHEDETRTIWIRVQRAMYRQLLDNADAATPVPFVADAALRALGARLAPAIRAERLRVLEQADALAHLVQEQGRLTLMRPAGPHGKQLLATCERLGLLFDGQEAFAALGRLWRSVSQERADDLHTLMRFGAVLRGGLALWRSVLDVDGGQTR